MDSQGFDLVGSVDMSVGSSDDNADREWVNFKDQLMIVDTWFFASKV